MKKNVATHIFTALNAMQIIMIGKQKKAGPNLMTIMRKYEKGTWKVNFMMMIGRV